MTYTAPNTVAAGETYSAAAHNVIVNDIIDLNTRANNYIFTNEAARDAAITAPVEGQVAYLTAPTIPAATGETQFVPSGVETIYNGTVWVCMTEVAAFTVNSGTVTSTSYTATLSGSPGANPSVTLVTGTRAIVSLGGFVAQNSIDYVRISVAVSGATTLAASDDWAMWFRPDQAVSNNQLQTSHVAVISGLTAGTNTFTLNYNVAGGTGTFSRRRIMVKGMP